MNESVSRQRLPILQLKAREGQRLKAGHLWVFSNEVDTAATPLKSFAAGDLVEIVAASGEVIGSGYVNPGSLICARILSRDPDRPPSRALIAQRIVAALALRERLYDQPCYRLVYGESDGLPGLVVDRFGDTLVAQISTAGMERMREDIVAALDEVISPSGILWQNSSPLRDLEGLERYVEPALGEIPETVDIDENGLRFSVPIGTGQKTGWFFDQRENRARLARYVRAGARVLDVCSYHGAWAVRAAASGAERVVCVDSSAVALEGARANATRNDVSLELIQDDAFDALKGLLAGDQRFDVVILDPPAFVKRRKDAGPGRAAYRRLNELGLRLLDDDGLLVSCSCSYHFDESALLAAIQHGARRAGRVVRLLEAGGQGPDHPVHPSIPETRYLNALFCHVTRSVS